VAELRKALKGEAAEPRLIQTAPAPAQVDRIVGDVKAS